LTNDFGRPPANTQRTLTGPGPGKPRESEIRDVLITPLFTGPLVRMHRYDCLASSRGPGEERSHPWHALALPHRGAFCLHLGKSTVLVDPNSVIYWNPTPFLSSHPFGGGDSGTGFIVPTDMLVEAIAPYDPGVVDRRDRIFRFPVAPSAPSVVLLERLLLMQVQRQDEIDDLSIDETVLDLVSVVATAPYRIRRVQARRPPSAVIEARRDWVEAVKATLFARFNERLRLADVAQAVGASPFSLCRAFKYFMGLSIHQYLRRLRLRSGLEMLATSNSSLVDIALETGFSSHAHFTTSFRSEFGLSPSGFRRSSLRGDAWRKAWDAARGLGEVPARGTTRGAH
jgi:AraC-like DNA-binding protein